MRLTHEQQQALSNVFKSELRAHDMTVWRYAHDIAHMSENTVYRIMRMQAGTIQHATLKRMRQFLGAERVDAIMNVSVPNALEANESTRLLAVPQGGRRPVLKLQGEPTIRQYVKRTVAGNGVERVQLARELIALFNKVLGD